MSDIENRIRKYVDSSDHTEVSEEFPFSVALAPVQVGLVSYIEVGDLPDMDALPYITERKRDFAFRVAMEYRSNREWAKEYRVTLSTIYGWLSDPAVKTYIGLARYEKRMFTLARRVVLENRVYDRLMEFLSKPITNDNASAMEKALEFAYGIISDSSKVSGNSKRAFGRYVSGSGSYEGPNPYAQTERDVTPASPKELEDLELRLEQARMVLRRAAEGKA